MKKEVRARRFNAKGEVMFYPGATWALQYTFKANAPDTEGLWGLAPGPSSFSAGGTYIAMYSQSEKGCSLEVYRVL